MARRGAFGIRFWVCLRNNVRLVEFGSGNVQVEVLHYMYRGFSGERLVSVMKWFFHSLGEAVSRFQDEVVCGGQGCWDKVETLGKYLSLNGG